MHLHCTRLNWDGLNIFNLKNPRFIKRLKVIKIWYIKIKITLSSLAYHH
jgi:hypothetical protein